MICLLGSNIWMESLLQSLQHWNHELVNGIVRVWATMLNKSCHGNVRRLSEVNTCAHKIVSLGVLHECSHHILEEWSQGILSLLLIISWFARLCKLFERRTALIRDSWSISDAFYYTIHKLIDNLWISQHICVVLTNSTHNPAYCFPYLSVFILEHLEQILKGLNNDLQEFLFVWSLGDGAQSHEWSILGFPVVELDVEGDKLDDWVHHMVA